MSLVVFWLFLLSHIEEKFLSPLPYKREPKREKYHQLLKKPKGYKGHIRWPGSKNAPPIIICGFVPISKVGFIKFNIEKKK